MLDLSLIDRDLSEQSPSELETTDERLAKVMSLAAADRFPEAAEVAQSLFEQNIYDFRLLGSFLFGVYLEKGMEIVPELLGTLVRTLSSSFAVWGPQNKKQLHADNMLKWLLATMLRDFRLHETLQDDTWKQWNSGSEFTIAERQGLKMVPELQERIINQLGNAKSLPYLLQLESMLQKMELSAQSARPRIGRGRDDILSVKLGGIEPPPPPPESISDGESGEGSAGSDEDSSSEESSESSPSSTDEESSSSDESSSASSPPSNSSSPSSSSSPSASSSPSSTSSSSSSPTSTSSSSSKSGNSDDSDSAKSSPSSSSSRDSADERSKEEDQERAEAEARAAEERAEEERKKRAEEIAAAQADENPTDEDAANGKGARILNLPESEPLRQLRRKLAAFQKLVSAGDEQRAAIVAADLLQTLEHFDPRLYLPSLFRRFFRVLSLVGNDLTPHMGERTDLSYKALLQLYQVDLDYFVRSASNHKN